MSDGAVSEQRVGRLLVRRAGETQADETEASEPWIELRREPLDSPRGAFRSRLAWLALMAIALGLLGFSARVGSIPGLGIGAFLVVLLALIAIVRSRRPLTLVRVSGAQVRITSPGGSEDLPLEQVERLGVGRDMDPLHTVWVAVHGRGRILLLDGLTAEEADLAAAQLGPFMPVGAS